MSDRHEWLDEALRLAAVDDARTIVPADVETRVMRAWDERRNDSDRVLDADRVLVGADLQVGPGPGPAWTAAGVVAACALGLVFLMGDGLAPVTQPAERQPPSVRDDRGTPEAASSTAVVAEPGTLVIPTPARPIAATPAHPSGGDGMLARETRPPVDLENSDFVLIPEPPVDTTTLQVVRVRMSRMAFASLGVPIENPEADGLMEVEMIVGDDGVARSIRRAAFVSVVDERGER